MSWSTEYLQLLYGPYGAPTGNLTGHVRGYSITHPWLIGRLGIKVLTVDGLAVIPIGLLQTSDPASGRWDFYIKADYVAAATAWDLIGRIVASDDEVTPENKAAVASEYAFFGVPGSYNSGADVLEDWVTGNTFAGSGGLSVADLVAGPLGYALTFDGTNDYIETTTVVSGLTTDATLDVVSTLTAAKFTALASIATSMFDDHRLVLWRLNTGHMRATVRPGSGGSVAANYTPSTSVGFHSYAAVSSSSLLEAFEDGVSKATEAKAAGLSMSGSTGFAIGRQFGRDAAYATSQISVVKLSASALSAAAIADSATNSLNNTSQFKLGAIVGDGYIDYITPGYYTFVVPDDGDYAVKCWGGGEGGDMGNSGTPVGGEGGAGGDFAQYTFEGLTAESTQLVTVGDTGYAGHSFGSGFGFQGGDSFIAIGDDVLAKGGGSGSTTVGDVIWTGGLGAAGYGTDPWDGGGGGGSGGSTGAGDAGSGSSGGAGGAPDGGSGGAGGSTSIGTAGTFPGGGGGGGGGNYGYDGGAGAHGRVRIEWSAGGDTFTAAAAVSGSASTLSASATFSPGTKTATATLSKGASTLSASVTFTPPTYTAVVALGAVKSTVAANATFSAGTKTATASLTSPASTLAAAATFSPGTKTASALLTAASSVLVASATFSSGTKTAAASLTGSATTLAASAQFTAPVFTASASLASSTTTLSASVAFNTVVRTVAASLSGSPSSLAASASHTRPTYTASAALSKGASTLAATATFTPITFQAAAILQPAPTTLAAVLLVTTAPTQTASIDGCVGISHTVAGCVEMGPVWTGRMIISPTFSGTQEINP